MAFRSLFRLLGAAAVLTASTLTAAEWRTNFHTDACQPKFQEYAKFHKAARGVPGARYLVYSCTTGNCAGLGDRIRATMMLLDKAINLNRVLLIDWRHPSPITEYLEPNAIDWRPVPSVPGETLDIHWWLPTNRSTPAPWRDQHEFNRSIDNATTVRVHTNDGYMVKGTEDGYTADTRSFHSCLFNMLYRPSAMVTDSAAQELYKMYYGIIPRRFIAVHLRMGGLEGEEKALDRHQGARDITVVSAAVEFAVTLATKRGIDPTVTPVAFVSDNRHLRFMLRNEFITGAVSPSAPNAKHIDIGSNSTPAHFVSEFVEVRILSQADCLLHSLSGFSAMAVWWTNISCHHTMMQALADMETKMSH